MPIDPPPIHSRDALLAYARQVEADAARRYESLAAMAEAAGNEGVAQLFHDLAASERDHLRRVPEPGAAPAETPEPPPEAPTEPQVSDDGGPEGITPWRALDDAVENEERTVRAFVSLAASAPDRETAAQAEALAREEADHVVRLRLARRRAARNEREDRGGLPVPLAAGHVTGPAELISTAIALERAAAERHRSQQVAGPATADPDTIAVLAETETRERSMVTTLRAAEAEAGAGAVPELPRLGVGAPGQVTDVGALLRLEAAAAFEVFDLYDRVVEATRDQGVLDEGQRLMAHAAAREALVRQRLREVTD